MGGFCQPEGFNPALQLLNFGSDLLLHMAAHTVVLIKLHGTASALLPRWGVFVHCVSHPLSCYKLTSFSFEFAQLSDKVQQK